MDQLVQEEINRIYADEVKSEFELQIEEEMLDGETPKEFWDKKLG